MGRFTRDIVPSQHIKLAVAAEAEAQRGNRRLAAASLRFGLRG